MELPPDIMEEIKSHVQDINTLLNICQLNKMINKQCSKQYYWQYFLSYHNINLPEIPLTTGQEWADYIKNILYYRADIINGIMKGYNRVFIKDDAANYILKLLYQISPTEHYDIGDRSNKIKLMFYQFDWLDDHNWFISYTDKYDSNEFGPMDEQTFKLILYDLIKNNFINDTDKIIQWGYNH